MTNIATLVFLVVVIMVSTPAIHDAAERFAWKQEKRFQILLNQMILIIFFSVVTWLYHVITVK